MGYLMACLKLVLSGLAIQGYRKSWVRADFPHWMDWVCSYLVSSTALPLASLITLPIIPNWSKHLGLPLMEISYQVICLLPWNFPEKIHHISELVQQRTGLTIARYHSRRDLRQLVTRLKDLYNGMIEGTTDNMPITDEEAQSMADQLLWFADPRLIKVIMKDEDSGRVFICLS